MTISNQQTLAGYESRNFDDLWPGVKSRAIMAIAKAELRTRLKIITTCTYRDDVRQRAYYEQGRTVPGKIVTNDPGPGGSHSLRIALDIAPCIKDHTGLHVFYETSKWHEIADEFKKEGFEWGGDWQKFVDKPHFQYTGGLALSKLRLMSQQELLETFKK